MIKIFRHKHLLKFVKSSKHHYHWKCTRCGRKVKERKEKFKWRFKMMARMNWFL